MPYIITNHYIDECDVPIIGPRSFSGTAKDILENPHRQHFHMYDDDGVRYYAGYYIGTADNMFEPLERFGMPYAGCTEIRYRNANGKYETL